MSYLVLISELFQEIKDLNIYDILEPCYHDTQSKITLGNEKLPLSFRKLGETERPLRVRKRMFGRAWPLRAPVREGLVPTWPQLLSSESVPCIVSCSNFSLVPYIFVQASILQ